MKRSELIAVLSAIGTDDSEVMDLLPGQEPLTIVGVGLGRPDIDEEGDEDTIDEDIIFITVTD
jgi:hypothetical protein